MKIFFENFMYLIVIEVVSFNNSFFIFMLVVKCIYEGWVWQNCLKEDEMINIRKKIKLVKFIKWIFKYKSI